MSNYFIAMWCNEGLECIYDGHQAQGIIAEWEKEYLVATLKDGECRARPNPIPLNMMILRARFNSQREYEIYGFNTTLTMKQVKDVFKKNPQTIVDVIRTTGNQIYSDYTSKERKLIV